jgi:hypothetical protein
MKVYHFAFYTIFAANFVIDADDHYACLNPTGDYYYYLANLTTFQHSWRS